MDLIKQAAKYSQIANREFQDTNRELLVSFDRDKLWTAILAWIRLHAHSDIETVEPNIVFYLRIIEGAFLDLLDRGAVKPVAEVTPLGQAALAEMRKRTGIGVEEVPPPAPVLTPEEMLECQVRDDWKKLSADQIRKSEPMAAFIATASNDLRRQTPWN